MKDKVTRDRTAVDQSENATVFDTDGRQANIVERGETNGGTYVILKQQDGTSLQIPLDLLQQRSDGDYSIPFAFSALDNATRSPQQGQVIPVIQEELQVNKRTIETGRGIRVHQHVVERTEVVDVPLQEDVLEVTRVPIGRPVDRAQIPQARQEGETFIVPVFEEVLVVERQLRLKEEVRITRHKREIRAPQHVVLQSQEVSIEHFDENTRWRGTTGMPSNPKQNTNSPGTSAGQ
ncbi:uncharacterized protein (TIGR02271 family) [Paucimonas lemoignei]|uniref:Uncharacterized protein (TIGR02271 family) n=1 Tax=Paucimonas lemoignei TaxID=29443 RepID=A0A4R3HU97_PAULE|nr:DUF2382 domain-containing protein [Paucimonas lemoignei]TCS35575.1 uncharacterized protein (TIGR02271 family) [Paucimonas lemoignei]